jgi:hypothetical protein
MDSNKKWKRSTRLDSVLSVLLVVLALGVLGLSAVEVHLDSAELNVSAMS